MKVAFLTQDLALSGGVGIVVEHAAQLVRRHGFDATLVLTREDTAPQWRFRGLEHLHVIGLDAAREQAYDVAVSTWWQTAAHLFDLRAERYASFVQSLEDRFYLPEEPERTQAALTHALPVRFVTEARWIADALEALQPGNRVLYVRNGIAKDVFAPPATPPARLASPLRIVVEGSRDIAFKAVDDALAACALMGEARHVTLVTPDGSDASPPARAAADRVLAGLAHAEMAALYAESHVVLKLSRIEGMAGPPLEGFHLGATCVTTPVTGHEEYVEHGVNGLVVDWDDLRGTARALDLLARDRVLLHELRTGALVTARGWPSVEQSGAFMAAALRAIRREPLPAPAAAGHRLSRDHAANLAEGQRRLIELTIANDVLKRTQEERAYLAAMQVRAAYQRALRPVGRVRRIVRRGG